MLLGFIIVELLASHDKFLGYVELFNRVLRRNCTHTTSEKDTATYNNPLSSEHKYICKISIYLQSVGIQNVWFQITHIGVICTNLKLWVAVARHNYIVINY